MNDIKFVKAREGLARPLPGEDHVSGIFMFASALPSGFEAENVKQITSIQNAEQLGIAQGSVAWGVLHYHISEFFRINPGGELWVGIFPKPGTVHYDDIKTLQREASGRIRQVAVYIDDAFATTQCTALQAVAETLEEEHMPLVVLMTADFSAVTDLTTLADLHALEAEKVAVIIGQDGGAEGEELFDEVGDTISCLGAALGAVSRAAVHENIGWVGRFNMATGPELDIIALANGDLLKDLDPNLIQGIHNKGYIFLRKHTGITGSYFNDSFTATAVTDDLFSIEANRTMDKAIRGVRTRLLPQLNSPLRVDAASGQLAPDTVAYLEDLGGQALEQMENDGELSGFQVVIPADQNVLSTSELEVRIVNVPVGVARSFKVKIGFAPTI